MQPLPLAALSLALMFASAHAQVNNEDVYQTPTLDDDHLVQQHTDSAAAIEAAQRQVEQLRASADDSPRALASALTRLGDAQLSGEDVAAAADAYAQALEVLEA